MSDKVEATFGTPLTPEQREKLRQESRIFRQALDVQLLGHRFDEMPDEQETP